MAHDGHGVFGGRRSTPADALLRDAFTTAREELELHELLVGSDWRDEVARQMRDRVAPEFYARNEGANRQTLREATHAAEGRLTRQGTGRLDLRAYQLLAGLARTAANLP